MFARRVTSMPDVSIADFFFFFDFSFFDDIYVFRPCCRRLLFAFLSSTCFSLLSMLPRRYVSCCHDYVDDVCLMRVLLSLFCYVYARVAVLRASLPSKIILYADFCALLRACCCLMFMRALSMLSAPTIIAMSFFRHADADLHYFFFFFFSVLIAADS